MKSRILNVSPRAYLRDLDSVNTVPSIVRTGYQNSLGEEERTPFDDSSTIINKTQIMLAPYMVTSSLAGFLTGTLYVTAAYDSKSSYLFRPVNNDSIVPYKEGLNNSPFSIGTTRNAGFPAQIYPGFTTPAESKIAVTIDITPAADFMNTRVSRDDSLLDSAGEFYDSPRSGFIYFNFKNKQWDSVGLTDPVTGADLNYSSNLTSSAGVITSGHKRLMAQFCSTPGISYKKTSAADYISSYISSPQDLSTYGYPFIGYPTSVFEAPYAPRYHATQDQVIKLSNFIKHPIVCDRISLRLPLTMRKIQDPNPAGDADYSFGRDIDNHTFFLYVQRRNNTFVADSENDVSSSIRFLIANKSIQSFNLNTFAPDDDLQAVLSEPGSTGDTAPGVWVNFYPLTKQVATDAGARVSITSAVLQPLITFRPRVYDQFYGSNSRLSAWRQTALANDNVMVRNFWRGGQYASGSTNLFQRWSVTNSTNNRMVGFSTGSQDNTSTSLLAGRGLVRSTWKSSGEIFTTNDLTPSSCSLASVYFPYVGNYPYTETPVILYPEDELIIGIDSGTYPNLDRVAPNDSGVDSSVLGVTGSLLTLRSAPAMVTLYGALVQEGHELLPELNQHLGSVAVSEDIHYDNVVTDQHDTLPRIALSSSYVDNIIDRSNPFGYGREVAGTYTHFTRTSPYDGLGVGYEEYEKSYWNGALQRNVRLMDSNHVYYDTMTPDPAAIVSGIVSASLLATGSYLAIPPTTFKDFDPTTIKIIDDETTPDELGVAPNNNRPASSTRDTMLRRSFTYETSTSETKRYRTLDIAIQYSVGMFKAWSVYSDFRARVMLYYNGFYPTNTSGVVAKNYNGAVSLRYGYLNPNLVGPTCVFRRDRYGQIRDMLEQSRHSKTHYYDELGKPHVSQAPVVATFVSSSTDIVISALQTQCSNLSIECTSSIPFVDDTRPRNRGTTLPTYRAVFGANNLIFGVTGSLRLQ
jgi:hypothetical protein